MLLLGLLLLSRFIAVELNHIDNEVTDRLFKVFIDNGRVESLEPQTKSDNLIFGWTAVKTETGRSFKKPRTLLDLRGRNITDFKHGWCNLGNNAFDELNLSHNRNTIITRRILNQLPRSIESVLLGDNGIKHLKNGVIDNPYLISLDLASNWISEIECGALVDLPQLKFLYLQDNRLWNTKFAATLPRNLEILQLNGNDITKISAKSFRRLKKLRFLSLSHNKITALQKKMFLGLQNLETLHLTDNPIEIVEKDLFESTTLLNMIVLDNGLEMNLTDIDSIQLPLNNTIFLIVSE